ncbi:MAG: asparagine synthetase B [Actinobacteria bacterium 13_2_20CM_2_71_6]|nr:MAG: asparagine synthetase B [Actinobacteria bacterium 13_2_20CM_2_71_6]
MCRIHGHFGAATPHEMRAAGAMQLHGGPDAQGYVSGGTWALGNNRLAIMDLDGGEQPYRLGEDIVVVFNGEIYNHAELRTELAAQGYRFADHCDGSILPALYHRYGRDFAQHLDGMFAVAIVDLRDEPTLVLATDDSGMKPLYYRWDDQRRQFSFASEIPALLAFRSVGNEPWLAGLDAYLTTKIPFGEQTMFQDIRVLPAGSTAWVTESRGLHVVQRGRPRPATLDVDLETAGREVYTFNSAYTGDWPFDERHFATEVAARCGPRHHQVEIDPATFPELLADVVWHLGQPNADPITLSTYVLFKAVHEAGFKVAMSGDAADEIFGGYGRIAAALGEREDWIPGYVEALAAVPRTLREQLYTDDYRMLLAERGTAAEAITRHLREQAADPGADRLAVLTEFEIGHRLPAYHLRRVDHLSMAHAVEVRLPFCQPRVVELARSLPTPLKVGGGKVKRALYAAADGHLPGSVLNRPKQPFTLPITAMLHDRAPMTAFARDLLSPDRLRADGLLDPVAVTGLIDRQVREPSDTTALAVWSLLVHQLWRDQFGAHHSNAPSPALPGRLS